MRPQGPGRADHMAEVLWEQLDMPLDCRIPLLVTDALAFPPPVVLVAVLRQLALFIKGPLRSRGIMIACGTLGGALQGFGLGGQWHFRWTARASGAVTTACLMADSPRASFLFYPEPALIWLKY